MFGTLSATIFSIALSYSISISDQLLFVTKNPHTARSIINDADSVDDQGNGRMTLWRGEAVGGVVMWLANVKLAPGPDIHTHLLASQRAAPGRPQ